MAKIANIKAYEILDSRGHPTLKAQIILDNGLTACASVPSGASKGKHEAFELRDNDPMRFLGMGVLKAVSAIQNQIADRLRGMDPTDQAKIDELLIDLDGTENKSRLGGNSLLAVSLASARVAAKSKEINLYKYLSDLYVNQSFSNFPRPMFNVINGGLHGWGKFNFQEFLFIPQPGFPFPAALEMGAEIYQRLKRNLKTKNFIYSVGDEGGFTPQFSTNEEVLDFLTETIKKSKYSLGSDVYLGLDLAASSFYRNNFYVLTKSGEPMKKNNYLNYLVAFAQRYSLYSLEDGLAEDDWEGWQNLTKRLGGSVLIIGDDLLVTNKKRLLQAIKLNACHGIIIKPNQIGTLTETLEVIRVAREANFKIIISHRSGETNDDFIADLAVGVGADFVKFGAPARGERVAKYNRLLEIYEDLVIKKLRY